MSQAHLRFKLRWSFVIATVVFLLSLIFSPGCVSQTEFSPDRLVFRTSNYFCLPFICWPSQEWSNPLLDRIREFDDDFTPPNSPARWHFVHGNQRPLLDTVRGWIGDAKPAYRHLREIDYHDRGSWLEWTDENPELARRLWREVIKLVRREDYSVLYAAVVAAK